MADLSPKVVDWFRAQAEKEARGLSYSLATDDANPDEVAESLKIGQAVGVPSVVVRGSQDTFRREAQAKETSGLLGKAPKTAAWLRDMENGALGKDDVPNLTWMEENTGALGRGVGRGVRTLPAIPKETGARIDAQLVGDIGKTAEQIYQEELRKLGPNVPLELRGTARQIAQARFEAVQGMSDKDRQEVLRRGAESLAQARDILDRVSEISMSEGAERFREGLAQADNTVMGVLGAFADDPVGGASFVTETAAEFLPVLMASTAATVATRSPGVGIATMGAGSFLMENSRSAMDFLEEQGVDVSTPEAAMEVIGNTDLMAEAADRGLTRGLIIGLMDAMSGGVAGQALMKSPAGEAVAQGFAQVLFGSSGEAAAQLATVGEIDWREVIVEGLAELATAPIEIGGVAGRGLLKQFSRAAKSGETQSTLAEIDQKAADSKLKQRSPEKFREFMEKVSDGLLYVPAGEFRDFFQAKDMDVEAAAEAYGFDAIEFDEMEASGGDIAIPAATYAARISGTDDAQWFHDNATLTQDEMSPAEAQRFNEEVRQLMDDALMEAERQREADLETRASDAQVYDNLFSQLRSAGRTRDVAEMEARVLTAFYRTMAERYGDDALDLSKRFGLEVRGPEQNRFRRRDALDVALNTLRSGKKPKTGDTLVDFVKRAGGVRDEGGDLERLDPPKGLIAETRKQAQERKSSPTLIGMPKEKTGLGMDEMGAKALEAGYFPDLGTDPGKVDVDLGRRLAEALSQRDPVYAEGEGPDTELAALEAELSRRGIDIAQSNDEIAEALVAGEMAQEQRGSIVFPSGGLEQGQTVINLFEGADLSTLLHEGGHYFLEAFSALASEGAAPQAMKDDLAVIRKYLGVESPKEPPIARFRRVAQRISASLPNVPAGHVRLWRGNRPGEEGANPSYTTDLAGIALPFQEGYGGELTFVDVPEGALRSRESGAATDAEFIISAELAASAKKVPVPDDPMVVEFTTEQHETWARGFEAYAMEGKAPSLELADAFARFKAWLTRIYRTVRGLNVKITPEVRDVMDRMLATDEEIRAAREAQNMDPLFTDQKAAGMSDAAWNTYQRMARRSEEEASQRLLSKTMAKVRRQKEKWWKDERKQVRAEVEKTVNTKREYRLIEMLANQRWIGGEDVPDMQMDREQLVDIYGAGVLEETSRTRLGGKRAIYAKGGEDIYTVADFFGFANPSEMVDILQNTGKRQDAIEAETDRIMSDRYGDPLNDGSIEEEALAAIHAEQQAKTVATEVRALADRAGLSTKNLTSRVFRQRAKMMIGRMSVREATRPDAFLAAERKAAKRAEDAFARVARGRDAQEALTAAARHKEQQLLNHYLYIEARDLKSEVDKARERMRRYSKATVREKLDGGYIEQIDALLEQYDFRVRSSGQVARAESLRAFVERMEAEGRGGDLAIDERLLDEARRVHYTRLNVDEFHGLMDTIANIDHLGRFKQKLIDRQRKRDLQEAASKVAGAIEKNLGSGKAKKQSGSLRNFFDLLFTVDTMLVEMDGGDEMGAAYDQIKADIDAGQSVEQKMQVELAEKFEGLFGAFSQRELREMQKPREIAGANERAWSKVEILSVALNMGNADNKQRLFDQSAHEHNRLTPEQADALLATLDRRDWDFVQSMWDLVDGYFPQLAEVHERRTGTKLRKVEATPVETGFGTLRGGYFPIKYDPELSAKAAKDEGSAWDKFISSGWGAKADVRSGMTKERQKSSGGRTLRLDLSVPFAHLRDTVRVVTLSEAVDNSWRILNHPGVTQAFIDAGRQNELDTLTLWLKDVAQGPIFNTDPLNRWSRIIKNNFTLSRLAFNFRTVALQVTGIGQSAATIGKRNMIRGYLDYRKRPAEVIANIVDRSPFMAERKSTFQKDIYDFANDVELSSPLANRWKKAKSTAGKWGFAPIVLTQFYAVDIPTWLGAYRAGIEKFGKEDRAIQYADRMVARAQDSGLMADRSAIERGTVSRGVQQSDFIRLFTTLGGYMIKKMNRGYVTVRRAGREIGEADSLAERAVLAGDAALDLALLYVFEAALMGLFYSLMDDLGEDEAENEDIRRFMAEEVGMAVVGGVPFVRDMASALRGYGGGGVYGSVMEIPANAFKQSLQWENDPAFRRAWSDVVGTMTGLPSTASMRAIEGAVAGDDVPMSEWAFGSNPLTR